MKKINVDNIQWRERKSPKGHYHRFRRDIALAFKHPKTGPKLPSEPPFEVELIRLPAGAKNCPFHSHAAEWEFYLIVAGTGNLGAGDCVLNPPGEAHQIINTGKADMLYYVIANNSAADFYYYPDSDKWGMWGPNFPDVPNFRQKVVNYYDSEENASPRKPPR